MGLLHRLQRWITPILYRVIADPLQRPALLQKLSGAAKLKIIEDKLFSVIEQGRGGFHALMPLDEGELHIGAVKNLGFCFRPVPVQIFSVFQPVFHGLVRDIRKQVCYPPLKIFPGHSVRAPQCPRCSLGPAGRKLSTRIG